MFRGNPTCRRPAYDVRHEPKLLIRVVLPVQEVLILVRQTLLVERLLLCASLLLCGIDTHLLTVLVLTQLTKCASPLQRLVVALQPCVSSKLHCLLGVLECVLATGGLDTGKLVLKVTLTLTFYDGLTATTKRALVRRCRIHARQCTTIVHYRLLLLEISDVLLIRRHERLHSAGTGCHLIVVLTRTQTT